MKITIDISDNYIKVISRWASVSRTLNKASRFLEEYVLGDNDEDIRDVTDITMIIDEIRVIEPFLNHLHQMVRSEIWRIEERKKMKILEHYTKKPTVSIILERIENAGRIEYRVHYTDYARGEDYENHIYYSIEEATIKYTEMKRENK